LHEPATASFRTVHKRENGMNIRKMTQTKAMSKP